MILLESVENKQDLFGDILWVFYKYLSVDPFLGLSEYIAKLPIHYPVICNFFSYVIG